MKRKSSKDILKGLSEEVDTLDDMLTALVDLLEEKGILTQEEWEARIKEKIKDNQKSKRYRDLQI